MDSNERSRKLWENLLQWASRANANDRRVNRRLGRSKDYVGTTRRRRKGCGTLAETLALVEATGQPDWVVFGKLFPAPVTPAELLRHLRQYLVGAVGKRETPQVVVRANKVWTSLDRRHAEPSRRPYLSVRRRLGWIDELRQADGGEALTQLENEIGYLLHSLGALKVAEPGLVADLAYGLALWGDIQRRAGGWKLALAACPLALELAERAEERWVIAHCLWMAAILVSDLGYPEYGLPWLDRAGNLFGLDHHQRHLPEVLATQGVLLLAVDRRQEGIAAFRDALARLPATDRRWRHTALLHLASATGQEGRPEEALGCLEILEREYTEKDLLRGGILWRKAACHLLAGQTDACVETFREAMRLVVTYGKRTDVAFALCDFAEQLLLRNLPAKARILAGEVVVLIGGASSPDQKLARLVEDFHALAVLRPLRQSDIDRTREALKALGPAPESTFPALKS